jgi:type IV pilus modification protein PilV
MQLKPSDGFALLESLMAMVLLTTGVLGLLWTHQYTLSLQRQHVLRDHAMRLADNMAQRMRVHASVAYAREWNLPSVAPGQNCQTSPCNDAQWLAWQIQQTNSELMQLPRGDMAVTPIQTLPNGWAVTVAWHDAAETFRTDNAWGTPTCPSEKSCWRLVFRSN